MAQTNSFSVVSNIGLLSAVGDCPSNQRDAGKINSLASLETVRSYLTEENGLAVVSTVQADGAVLSTVVNCGVVDHPITKESCVAFVSGGNAACLKHIRRGSSITVAIRRSWNWVAVTGDSELVGPNDNELGLSSDNVRVLLRDIFMAAGGTHDDWYAYDQTMLDEARTAVLITPTRLRSNV